MEWMGTRNSDWKDFPWRRRRRPKLDHMDRMAIGRNALPYWHVFNYTLQPQVTLDAAVAPAGNFIALKLIAFATQAKGFRTQLRQTVDQSGSGCSFSKVGIEQSNFAGAFGGNNLPLLLKCPYYAPNLLTILNRCANKAIGTDPAAGVNRIQICIQGVRTKN